jgi:hypothetical protein
VHQVLLLALETIRGDPEDVNNPFHWNKVCLNLPGDPLYDPRKPKLMRIHQDIGSMAGMIVSYVDDMRAAADSDETFWQILHVVSSQTAYLGIQVATQKTRPPSPNLGPWAGAMVVLDNEGVGVKATQEKWENTKVLLKHTLSLIDHGSLIKRK